MTIASSDVAVVATTVPPADRRALSQAWYSALHLAEGGAARPHPAARLRSGENAATPAQRRPGGPAEPQAARFPGAGRMAAAAPRRDGAGTAERRAPRSELSRKMERALARPAARPSAATVAVHAAGGRVALVVRSDGGAVRIVAVCAAPLRERVERALAQARFGLAARGVTLREAVR